MYIVNFLYTKLPLVQFISCKVCIDRPKHSNFQLTKMISYLNAIANTQNTCSITCSFRVLKVLTSQICALPINMHLYISQ